MIASEFPSSTVYLVADNLKYAQTAEKNIKENRLQNASVYVDDTLQCLQGRLAAIVIMKPSGYEGKKVMKFRVAESARHLVPEGQLYLVTHMRRGAPGLMDMLDEIFGDHEVLEKGAGGVRVVRATNTAFKREEDHDEGAANIIEAQILSKQYKFQTSQGLFSREQVDKGTILLLESVGINDAWTILDLGCGYGVIGITIADRCPETKVVLVDVDRQAIKATMANTRLNDVERNTQVIMSDGLKELSEFRFDLILSHFPLHIPKPEQARLLREARDALTPEGRLCLVALSSYDLQPMLQSIFNNISIIVDTSESEMQGGKYRVLCASGIAR
jgi:16S rRNA (guanine1207-N2)-methyltransferase